MEYAFKTLPKLLSRALHRIPTYERIISILEEGCGAADYPNIMLYGAEGFPHISLWDSAIGRKYGNETFKRRECIWNKQWLYQETQYFFEIDLQHPSQPKDVMTLSDFLREIMNHPCMHSERHIFVLKNVDVICSRGFSFMMRVLLERFSKNAWFICTTHRYGAIEPPIRSRFMALRIPLLSAYEIRDILSDAELVLPTECIKHNVRNLFVATFLAVSSKEEKEYPYSLDDLSRFHAPFIQDIIKTPSPSIEQIRAITQKLSVNGYTMAQITLDLLHFVKPKDRHTFVMKAQTIDHMYNKTEKYRKPLYIEYLLHTMIYGLK